MPPPIELLESLCAVPTAPFAEHLVIDWIIRRMKQRKRVAVSRDDTGNIMLELPGISRGPRMVLVAHLDHPGFIAQEMEDKRTLRARFHGGVHAKYFKGSHVRFFDHDREVRGQIVGVDVDPAGKPVGATIKIGSIVPRGTVGMWDQGEPKIKAHKFHCRVCDDLAGAAAALAVLDKLLRASLPTPVAVLLTRAEEEGFIGAIAAAQNRQLLRATDLIISIECSAEQPYAQQGNGVILRTGDRTSIFNSAFTRFIQLRAEEIARKDPGFQWQRALMPGGTCEATVFDAWNYFAAAVCIPLANYHNMDTKTGKIAPEFVDLRDWNNLVTLLADVAPNACDFPGDHVDLRDKLAKRFDTYKSLL
ncbi:MAG: M20/M25/M40 family metallo-hydrolase [Burkholderiales bacterium]|nr:M20/M25/M40 family metallo-hydrolase [Phycisphaerae bacterium]